MNKTTIVLMVVLVGMAAAYVYWFTDWFARPTIQILAQVRPNRNLTATAPGETVTYPVAFAFDRNVKLTELKVVCAAEAATNKYAHAVWHMISDSNSVPVKAVVYGRPVYGMKPKIPQARPEPLQPAMVYRLYVTAGKCRGQIDFKTTEAPGASGGG